MSENRKNWLYPDASGLYFPHDGFIMRATDGKQYDYEEECELLNEYDKKYNEYRNDVLRLEKENEQLKQSYKEFEDECQSTFNAMNRKQNDLYRKNFKLKEENEQLEKENNELKQSIRVIYDLIDGYIAIADKYRKPIKSLSLGDDLGYWNGVYQYMKKLRERIGIL